MAVVFSPLRKLPIQLVLDRHDETSRREDTLGERNILDVAVIVMQVSQLRNRPRPQPNGGLFFSVPCPLNHRAPQLRMKVLWDSRVFLWLLVDLFSSPKVRNTSESRIYDVLVVVLQMPSREREGGGMETERNLNRSGLAPTS
jgi:hypothetical protein